MRATVIPSLNLEKQLWQQGFVHVAGVDEAGRGPLAGPVTAGAVISSVRDSKYMTAHQRSLAFNEICQHSTAYGVSIVSAEEIDSIGINRAVKKAMEAALIDAQQRLGETLSFVIVDGSKTLTLDGFTSQKIKAGGLYHYSIAAGSILAKVTRDRIMHQVATLFPLYGFEKHVGYGTAAHLAAMKQFGLCHEHRRSFQPVREVLTNFENKAGHNKNRDKFKKGEHALTLLA
jgi:ribonuclease HII